MTPLLHALFFLSGASALIFETLWFRQTGLVFGNSIWATTLVLGSFMGGLAIGNGLTARYGHRVARPVRAYAQLELVVAAMGLGLVLLLPKLTVIVAPVFRPMLEVSGLLNAMRFSISFLLLLMPATAMGATLPILTKALGARDAQFGKVLGRLYGWNTLGAVIGAFSSEALLIGALGVVGTGVAAACLNGLAACVAFGLSLLWERTAEEELAGSRQRLGIPAAAQGFLVAAFLSGATLLALEVVWFRFLLLFVYGTSLAFAVMLAVVLAGIGAGGLLASSWLRISPTAHRHVPTLALLAGVVTILPYAHFDLLVNAMFDAALQRGEVVYLAKPLSIAVLAIPLMLPTSLLSGALFTLIGESAKQRLGSDVRTAGLLTFANTTGGMLGSLLGGFLLLPWLGMERSLLLLAILYGGVAACTLARGRPEWLRWHGPLPLAGATVSLVVAALLFPSAKFVEHYVLNPVQASLKAGMHIVALRENPSETLIYLRKDFLGEPRYFRMMTNGFGMATTRTMGARYMKLYAYWPVAIHPDPKNALLISFGLGSTAKAITDTAQFETIDFVEISADVLELAAVIFPSPEENPVHDPRVTSHVEDGRFFLQTTERRFDVITGEPPPPKSAGVVNLYTREYFQLIHDRLNEGGITTYWLPMHLLEDSDGTAIIRAFCDVFADCSLWAGTTWDWMLVGSRGAVGRVSEEQFSRQWNDPAVAPEIRALGLELPEQLGALFIADAETLAEWTRNTLPLVDDRPHRVSMDPADPAATEPMVRAWTNAKEARRRFAESAYIRRTWPPAMREKSLAYFDSQAVLNEILLYLVPRKLDEEELFWVLTETSLRAPVLWMLDTDENQQRILERRGTEGLPPAGRARLLGARALADRDYAAAAEHFARGLEQAPAARRLASLHLFALCMAGRLEEAATAARSIAERTDPTPATREYWARMERLFGLPDPYPRDLSSRS